MNSEQQYIDDAKRSGISPPGSRRTDQSASLPVKEYLSYREMAEFLDIKVATLRKWKCLGKVTFTSFKGRIYFPVKDVLREMKRNTIKAAETQLEELGL